MHQAPAGVGQGYTLGQVSPPIDLRGDSLQDPDAELKAPGSDLDDDVPLPGELDGDDGAEEDGGAEEPAWLPPASGTNVTLQKANKTAARIVVDLTQPNDHLADTTTAQWEAAPALFAGGWPQ
eukprot:jgi/Tetstr1/436478/TSEL_025306.t1